jgi:hypothetical protein
MRSCQIELILFSQQDLLAAVIVRVREAEHILRKRKIDVKVTHRATLQKRNIENR